MRSNFGDAPLTELADRLACVAVPFRAFSCLELGLRMSVVRLADGSVVVHSPVALTTEVRAAIDALGPVRFVVAPNAFHHLFVKDALAAWPDAQLVAPAALRKKRPDLTIHLELEALEDQPLAAWRSELIPISIRGSMLHETVLYHAPSRSLLSADLLENFVSVEHWFTRAYLKLGGIYGKPALHPLLHMVYRDRALARQGVSRILDLALDRIVVAHGEIVTARPEEALREGLGFLFK